MHRTMKPAQLLFLFMFLSEGFTTTNTEELIIRIRRHWFPQS